MHDGSFYYDAYQHALQYLLIVTIVEIHMLVLDVCVYLSSTEILKDLMFFISVDFI